MSLSSVRPFFRTGLESLGFVEHEDAFNYEDIGANILDGRFHMASGTITSGPTSHIAHSFLYEMTIRIFRKGFRDTLAAYDAIDADAQSVYEYFLDTANRLTQYPVPLNIKDIIPESYLALPLAESNDNAIILEMVFTARLEQCFTAEF